MFIFMKQKSLLHCLFVNTTSVSICTPVDRYELLERDKKPVSSNGINSYSFKCLPEHLR